MCHIVPAVPPEFNGLGDYARQLWRHWPEPKPEWHVAALRVPAGAAQAWPGVTFHEFQPTAESLLEALLESRAETVALHYVGHGYHPKGVPLWLPKALARWKPATGGRLVTFFHELFAVAPPWRMTAYLTPVAILLLRRLVSLSDDCATNCELYARQIRTYGGLPITARVIPVGSNVPSASPARPWTGETVPEGGFRVAVFGSYGSRVLAARQHGRLLTRMRQLGLLHSLTLIGREGDGKDVELVRTFCAPATRFDASEDEVARELSSAHLCPTHADADRLGKSGVVAAACANGAVPIVAAPSRAVGPYVPNPPRNPNHAIGVLTDPERLCTVRRAVEKHAQLSSWPAIVQDWLSLAGGPGGGDAATAACSRQQPGMEFLRR